MQSTMEKSERKARETVMPAGVVPPAIFGGHGATR